MIQKPPTLPASLPRRVAAQVIELGGACGGIYLVWLIISFFRGQAVSPVVDAYNDLANHLSLLKLTGSLDVAVADPQSGLFGWCLYYFFGAVGFVIMAALAIAAGCLVSRIVLVGWSQLLKELQQSRCAHQWIEVKSHRSHDIGLVVDECSQCGAMRNDVR
jgi:hypothetical protein